MLLIALLAPLLWGASVAPRPVALSLIWVGPSLVVWIILSLAKVRVIARCAISFVPFCALVLLDLLTGGCSSCGKSVTILGRVIDAGTGQPVRDAQVYALETFYFGPSDRVEKRLENCRTRPDLYEGQSRFALTSAQGNFYLSVMVFWGESTGLVNTFTRNLGLVERPPRDHFVLVVRAEGYEEARQNMASGRWLNRQSGLQNAALYQEDPIRLIMRTPGSLAGGGTQPDPSRDR